MTPSAKTFRYDAFLSYRHVEPDRAFARDLYARLTEAGLRVAIDEVDSPGGEPVYSEMVRCVRASRFTLAIVSSRYLESGYTEEEALFSATLGLEERRRRLIPVILEQVEQAKRPDWLRGLVEIDFSASGPLVPPFQRLLDRLQSREPEPAGSELALPASRDPRGDLTRALEEAYQREEELLTEGSDPSAVKAEILDLRRQLREGGRLHPGDFLSNGRFKLIAPLGKGGFATVWKAFDRRERTAVAIKVLHGQLVDDRTRLERFFRGARKMAELHHPGIVRVTEKRLDEGGFHFFVMEYLAGGDLRDAVLAGKVPLERVVPLIQEVAAALQHAHDQAIVHRDVKPANILLDGDGRPKLTDFDLVRAVDTTGGTRDGTMLGTLLYSAPEVLDHPEEAGTTADVYSLAMTAAFCLFGHDLPREVLRDAEGFLRRLACSCAVQNVLAKGAAWRPEERFSTVHQLSLMLVQAWTEPPDLKGEVFARRTADRIARDSERPSLEERLRLALLKREASERSRAVLRIVEAALPLGREDLEGLGLASWALDYAPGRSPLADESAAARDLWQRLWAPIHRKAVPPQVRSSGRHWVSVPGGRFEMGSRSSEFDHERPVHTVSLSPFRILAHPVTNQEYRRFNPVQVGEDNLPVVNVDWFAAYAYSAWLGGRLPTEAEWEYAARAGRQHEYCDRQGRPMPLKKVGWYSENSGGSRHAVEKLEPNPWGLFDMIGNTWEWVADWFGTYSAEEQENPWGPPCGDGRVIRGGCFLDVASLARGACRLLWNPGVMFEVQGFRVVLPGTGSETLD